MTEHKLFFSLLSHLSSRMALFYTGLLSRTDLSTWQSTHSLSSLPSSRKDQPTWETTFTLLHWLFFTDYLSHISSSPLSTMRRQHPIYGLLVSGNLFFHHSSFFLNQRILGETNWIFSTPAFNFSILIPVLTTASQLLLWHSASEYRLFIFNRFLLPVSYSTRVTFLTVIKLFETHKYSRPHSWTSFLLNVTRGQTTICPFIKNSYKTIYIR